MANSTNIKPSGAQQKDYITAENILNAVPYDVSDADKALIEKACAYAKEKHEGQKRYEGSPYYTHPFEVGRMLGELGMSANTIAAGILHDTIEDTDTTYDDLVKEFNEEIAFLVEGVSHLGEVRYHGLSSRIKSLQKLFVATSKDVRVMLIKLTDRLHNMRTLSFVPREKQKRIAEETQRVYAPIADRLGMGMMKTELEDCAFKYLSPEKYNEVHAKIEKAVGLVSIEEIEKRMREFLQKNGIKDSEVSSRAKSVYSTYMKMQYKKYDFERVHDLLALRILVKDIPAAYTALGIIHTQWHPIPNTLKDYISLPKPNGYQALHTRVIIDEHILEIQILTRDMYRHSQVGIAAHFNYKEKRFGTPGIKVQWFEKLLSNQDAAPDEQKLNRDNKSNQEDNRMAFAKDLESDFLCERMFIFTPKGEVVDLPIGATVIDFAFAIHSDIALHAEGAMVNGKYVSLKYELSNGDIVNVKTIKKTTVTKKWLDWVHTSEARARIRRSIKKNS